MALILQLSLKPTIVMLHPWATGTSLDFELRHRTGISWWYAGRSDRVLARLRLTFEKVFHGSACSLELLTLKSVHAPASLLVSEDEGYEEQSCSHWRMDMEQKHSCSSHGSLSQSCPAETCFNHCHSINPWG